MQLLAEWLDDAENAAPEERMTAADVRITIGNQNVTQHVVGEKVVDHVTIALYGLVHGLTHGWWSIFGSRDNEISLLSYRSGYVMPDIRIRFDGAVFEIEAKQCNYRNPDTRFFGGAPEVMARAVGEEVLAKIVETILTRLRNKGLGETSAELRWHRVRSSRSSAEEAAFCEAAGALGFDPYQIPDDVAEFIEGAEQLFEPEPLAEFVSGSKGVDRSKLLDWVNRMRRHRGSRYRVPDLRAAVDEAISIAPPQEDEKVWATGYRRARAMRRALDLPHDARFSSFRDIANKLGAAAAYNLAPQIDGLRALRTVREDGIQIHLRNHGRSLEARSAQLFAMARAVGDVACFPFSGAAPVNDLHYAYRQAAGRAFAAEFLAPIDEIRSMLADKHDVVTIANEFSVSTAVIDRQIENEIRIRRACESTDVC